MNLRINISLLLSTLVLVSCSSHQNTKKDSPMQSMMSDSIELDDENSYNTEEGIDEERYTADTIEEAEQVLRRDQRTQDYIIQKGDTLMLIAFKVSGNYTNWRKIKALNPQLNSYANLSEGEKIKVMLINKNLPPRASGTPYLIKRNETLQKISQNIYSTTKRWFQLYQHNKDLIKDPDIIYAGFTIYYRPAGSYQRDLANKK